MNIIRTACAKTCQHGATFIVETPLGYVNVMEVGDQPLTRDRLSR